MEETNTNKDAENRINTDTQDIPNVQQRQNEEQRGKCKTAQRGKVAVQDITLIGMMVAVIEVCKFALAGIPNIELTSFWLILFTICFGWKIVFVVPVFILIEGVVFGVGPWWVSYLYIWPLLVLFAWIFRKKENVWFWAILSGAFGLSFGALCAIYYVVVGAGDRGLQDGLYAGFTWWVAGIPWDITHGIGNFVLMLILYKPMRFVIKSIQKENRK